MPLTDAEKLVVEALDSLLKQDAQLGLAIHHNDKTQSQERGYEYLHNLIDDMFAVKAAELMHAESTCRAFSKVHSYKYIDDPSFHTAMKKELVAEAVPAKEREQALNFIESILKELKSTHGIWEEKDAGFSDRLDEIREVSKPGKLGDFEIHDVEGYNKANVTWDKTDASPGHTPSD